MLEGKKQYIFSQSLLTLHLTYNKPSKHPSTCPSLDLKGNFTPQGVYLE